MNRLNGVDVIQHKHKFCDHEESKKYWNDWNRRKHALDIKGFSTLIKNN
ncbi:MAG: hypothetical protein RSA91_00940 [Bacilli bacterium]